MYAIHLESKNFSSAQSIKDKQYADESDEKRRISVHYESTRGTGTKIWKSIEIRSKYSTR